ncbi:MAG: hypothetical protein C5B60_05570 [Chloroflexi bacterium]|nr:MAG: hypothetical protein C5B60_05570 [Chloroflexota bacterium]
MIPREQTTIPTGKFVERYTKRADILTRAGNLMEMGYNVTIEWERAESDWRLVYWKEMGKEAESK